MKIRQRVGADLYHAEKRTATQTDMTKNVATDIHCHLHLPLPQSQYSEVCAI
jgi:hypothetical protein